MVWSGLVWDLMSEEFQPLSIDNNLQQTAVEVDYSVYY
jgi:hypothetical protein